MIPAPEISYRSLRVWQRNKDVFFGLWKTDALPLFLEPLVILSVMGMGVGQVVPEVHGQSYLEFIAPGVLASYVMFAPAFENSWGSYVRMAIRRTYDAIIVTPLSIDDVTTGEILWGATRAVMMSVIMLSIITAMGLVSSPIAILVIPMAAIFGFMFGSLAITFASLAPSLNAFNFFFSLFVYPMFFFSGVFFPLHELPTGLREFAWVLPLTPAVHIARNLVDGNLTLSMLWSVLAITGTAIVFYPLALILMRRRLIR